MVFDWYQAVHITSRKKIHGDKIHGDRVFEIHEAAETARTKGDSMPVRFLRRTRHWTDGAIIGGKTFVQEVGCRFESPENHERVMKKKLSRGDVPGGVLYCFKRLRTALE